MSDPPPTDWRTDTHELLAPPPPREPCAAARELVLRYQGKERTQLIIGVVFLLLGSLVSVIFGQGAVSDVRIALFGVPGTGTITETRLETSMEKNGEHPLRIAFTYEDAGQRSGASYTTRGSVAERVTVGSQQPIEYVPGSPGVARVTGSELAPFGWFGLIPLLFPLVGAGVTFQAVRSNRRQSRAYRHGVATRGLVTARTEDTTVSSNRRHPMRVRWEFHVDGVRHEGELSHFDHGLILDAVPRDEVVVLYDPRAPGTTNTIFVGSSRAETP